jgi:helix-turn-helix protein
MSRYRLLPLPAQEAVLRDHCAHARYVWNLALEQYQHWRPGRKGARPGGDVNAARNIAAGHVVTARGGFRDTGPVNREPQLLASFTGL